MERDALRHRRPARATVLAVLTSAVLVVAPALAHADRSVHLEAGFETKQATASLTVPRDWRVQVGAHATGATLIAPSSRAGCRHVLRLDLDLLYVGSQVTSAQWVAARLTDAGPLFATSGPASYSWAVAMRRHARAGTAAAALVAGTGRYGAIMAEVPASATLSGDCPATQARRAARRLGRVLADTRLTIAARR